MKAPLKRPFAQQTLNKQTFSFISRIIAIFQKVVITKPYPYRKEVSLPLRYKEVLLEYCFIFFKFYEKLDVITLEL